MKKRPLYEKVKETLLGRLAKDFWRPGELLPSELKLAEEFRVSQGTIRRALADLVSQNMLTRHQGRGTAVAEHTPFGFFHLFRDDGVRELPESKTLRLSGARANRSERDALELAAGNRVIRILRIRYLNLEPKMLETLTLPQKLFPGLEKIPARDLPNTVYRFYEQQFGIPIVGKRERLRAVAATPTEALHLNIEVDRPLMEIECVAFSHERQPIEWRLSRCLTDEHYYCNPPESP